MPTTCGECKYKDLCPRQLRHKLERPHLKNKAKIKAGGVAQMAEACLASSNSSITTVTTTTKPPNT
jgi:hypothetical protein